MANETDAALEQLLAKQAIRECLERFCRGMDRFDRDCFLSAFHDDAVIAAGPYVGDAAGCWDWAMPLHEQAQDRTQHGLLQSGIDIDGDTAHAETYYRFVGCNKDGSLLMAGGRYIDRLERRGGIWRIALRTNLVEWSCAPPAIPLPFADMAGADANGVSSRDRDDPSYRRPLVNLR